MTTEPVIHIRDLVVGFGDRNVLDHVSVDVRRGEIFGFVGGSGSGKSVLLRTIIGLVPSREGTVDVLGTRLTEARTLSGDQSSEDGAFSSSRVRCSLP